MKKGILGPVLLMLAALIWGSSFIVMKDAVDFLTPAMLLSIRFFLATIFMIILFFKFVKTIKKQDLIKGAITGGLLFLAYYVQTIGLTMTTPSKNAFLTAIYCAIVPFLVWLFYHRKPDTYNFIAALLCFIGVGCVSLSGNLTIQMGDFLTIIGGVFFALHIVAIKRFTKEIHPISLTTMQFGFAAIYATILAIIVEDVGIVSAISSTTALQILYLAFFATTLALLFQNLGQEMTSECNAAIILSLESVFGVLFSVMLYGEVLSVRVIIGFVLIFVALLISETKLSFLKKKER